MPHLEHSNPSVKVAMIKAFLLTTAFLILIIYDKSSQIKPSSTEFFHQAFRFHVHCPVTTSSDGSFLHLMEYLDI